jgi:hypothetical protein
LEPGQVAGFTEHWSVFEFDYPGGGSEIELGRLRTMVLGKKETTKGD